MRKMQKLWPTLMGQWRDSVNLVLGLWLIAAPWVMGFTNTGLFEWNAYACGVIIAVSAAAAITEFHEWEEWMDAAIGVWLMVSPWVLGMTMMSAMMIMFFVVGLAVAVMALWTEYSIHHHGAKPTS